MDCFATTSTLFGLKINVSETEFWYQPPPEDPTPCLDVLVNGITHSKIDLGSAVSSINSSDPELERRIQAATKAFGSLHGRVCPRQRTTKVKVYNAAVLLALFYPTECMTLYTNYKEAQQNTTGAPASNHWDPLARQNSGCRIVEKSQVTQCRGTQHSSVLAGHVQRMPDSRHLKVVCGELADGRRKQGQKLRFKDLVRRHMKNEGINPDI